MGCSWSVYVGEPIAEGGFGTVHVGWKGRRTVALKRAHRTRESLLCNEWRMLRLVAPHAHVLAAKELVVVEGELYLVLPLADGDLFHYMVAHERGLAAPEATQWMEQMLAAVAHVHACGAVHRDLKVENWLRFGARLQLADFGLAMTLRREERLAKVVGSPAYLAPETVRPYDGYLADAWSLGVCLFVLASGFLPFQRADARLVEHAECVPTALFEWHRVERTISARMRVAVHVLLQPVARRTDVATARDFA